MKTIESDGGPIIGIERRHLRAWLGIDGCRFFSKDALYKSDYQWICASIHHHGQKPQSSGVVQGNYGQIIVLSQPFETAIIKIEADMCLIAQVEYADDNWSICNLSKNDFESPLLDYHSHRFSLSTNEEFVFFDAALPGSEILDKCLMVAVNSGLHEIKTAYAQADSKGLFLSIIRSV